MADKEEVMSEHISYNKMVERKSFSKKTRELVAAKTNNKCGYCGEDLQPRWHLDHMNSLWDIYIMNNQEGSEYKDPNHIDNLIASCPRCNLYKSSESVEKFRKSIKDIRRKLRDYYKPYAIGVKYGVIVEADIDIVFYFETLKG